MLWLMFMKNLLRGIHHRQSIVIPFCRYSNIYSHNIKKWFTSACIWLEIHLSINFLFPFAVYELRANYFLFFCEFCNSWLFSIRVVNRTCDWLIQSIIFNVYSTHVWAAYFHRVLSINKGYFAMETYSLNSNNIDNLCLCSISFSCFAQCYSHLIHIFEHSNRTQNGPKQSYMFTLWFSCARWWCV